jgi:hypothetical protein
MAATEPAPLAADLPRYAPSVPLPPYRYVPGVNHHPKRDPRGHQYGRVEAPIAFVPPGEWRQNLDYLHGVDLFNRGYFWEAHEVWEGIWHAATADVVCRDFLKGMIQSTGAMLKHHASDGELGDSLATSALALLTRVERTTPDGVYMGLDLRGWLPRFAAFFTTGAREPGPRPAPAPSARAELVLRLASDAPQGS